MCIQILRCHGGCWHLYRAGWLSCDKAKARPNKELCLPGSGNKRDLPYAFNRVIDPNEPMFCEMCIAEMNEGKHRPWDVIAQVKAAVKDAQKRDKAFIERAARLTEE